MTRKQGFARRTLIAASIGFVALAGQATAHPHVFMGGGLDFVISQDKTLDAVNVTWVYDEFETLYILSHHELSLNKDGVLDEEDRLALVGFRNAFPDDFDGSTHLTAGGTTPQLGLPQGLDAHIIDGRMTITFTRPLVTPIDMTQGPISAAFYESTYFFAFSITQDPKIIGQRAACSAQMAAFDPSEESEEMKDMLAKLSREETPEDRSVGAIFADRIIVSCG